MTLGTALLQGTQLFEDGAVPAPRLTAEVLLSFAIGRERTYLYAHPEEELTELGWIHYGRYLHQRLNGKPTQYITHRQEFYGREFLVNPDVLIPRHETEHVIEQALARIRPGDIVLDAGTGSGAIAITLALESKARLLATDISVPALEVARRNAASLNATVQFIAADLVSCVPTSSLDLLVSNPPYVPLSQREGLQREVRDFEPHVALFGGPSGFELYERLIADGARTLRPYGWVVLELGYNSEERVRAMLHGWEAIETHPDLAGIPRVATARRPA